MEPRDLAYADWKAGMKYQAIADKYDVSLSAVKSWAARDWKLREVATKPGKKSQPQPSKVATKRTSRVAPVSVDKRLADAVDENEELTEKQRLFCLCYMESFNASQAARDAGYSENTAGQIGYQLLQKTSISKEIAEMKKIKNASLGGLCGEDVIELHMRIAFANMSKFTEFKGKTVPVLHKGEVVTMEHPDTGKHIPVTQTVNVVKLKDSTQVDGQLITEVSEGREGVKIKLRDSNRSMAFLERYFLLNPMDRHRKEYDYQRLELERQRIEADQQSQGGVTSASELLEDSLTVSYSKRKAVHEDD